MGFGSELESSRAALETALTSAGVRVAVPGVAEPPCVLIGGPRGTWIDTTEIGRGGVIASWRILAIAGKRDDAAALAELVALVGLVLDALRALSGFRVGPVSGFGSTDLGGRVYLACEILTSDSLNT